MPFAQSGLPFAAGSQTSYTAAVRVHATRAAKTRIYLQHLLKGGSTDHEAHAATGLPISSICSIRGSLIAAGLVEKGSTTRPSPYGLANSIWWLTSAGRAAAERLEAHE